MSERPDTVPATERADRPLTCPACGHALSMFHEPEIAGRERFAMKIADRVASWSFPVTMLVLLGAWIAMNVIWRPFDPYPVVVLAVISAVLASVAALQGPLILMKQRRSAERDRHRDREALVVAQHAEADIHHLDAKLDALAEQLAAVRDAR